MDKIEYYKNYRIYLLQKRYIEITDYIVELQNHINNIYQKNIINSIKKNIVLGKLFEITKCINTKYNNYINNKLENVEENNNEKFNKIIKKIKKTLSQDKIFEIIDNYYDFEIENINKPLNLLYQQIYQIISDYGYPSIKKLLYNILNKKKIFKENIKKIINEIDDSVIPISYEYYDVKNKKDHLRSNYQIPKHMKEDLLD